ncbi:MAG: hypothetical protein ABI647_26910 [Gemmatimonadota bacterium]
MLEGSEQTPRQGVVMKKERFDLAAALAARWADAALSWPHA